MTRHVIDLLAERDCSPMCLLGREAGPCVCRCAGKWHAALIDASIEEPSLGPCTRCEREAHEKCLDRWRTYVGPDEPLPERHCGCGCWEVSQPKPTASVCGSELDK